MKKVFLVLFVLTSLVAYSQDDPVSADKDGKGNGSFVPDISHCLTLLQQNATVKSVEALLPEYSMFGVVGASYTYKFDYKNTHIKLWVIVKPHTQLVESLSLTFIGTEGFNVVPIQAEIKKYGFAYNMKDTYNSQSSVCADCTYYDGPAGRYLVLHKSGNFSLHNK